MAEVRWTPNADEDRASIRSYIAKDSPRAAARMDAIFNEAVGKLAEFPRLGRRGRVPGTRELRPHRTYRLIYEVIDDTVWVLNVVHTARQWPASAG